MNSKINSLISVLLMFSMMPYQAWGGEIEETGSTPLKVSVPSDVNHLPSQKTIKKRTISGRVTDKIDGMPVIGAGIVIKGTKTGTLTDNDGNFNLTVKSGDILVVSCLGYAAKEVDVEDLAVISIKLEADSNMLDGVVVVGAGTQKKITVTGSITSIDGNSLITPTASLTNAFAGKLAGVIATTTSGAPGSSSEFYIRGIGTFGGRARPLIMLDDVEISPADLNNIPAETIESFSILKDASATAIYGARGANGVMLVTTKTGTENQRTKVNVTVENSFNVITKFPEFVDGATWMEMYNEAQRTRTPGSADKYSAEEIRSTREHVNPYMYPDVNWNNVIFKKMAMSRRANINVSGGGAKATFYLSIQANHDTGLLNTKKIYSWDNNINNLGFNFQNNIRYKLTPSTTIDMRMNAQVRNNQGPNYSPSDLFNMTLTSNPINFPVTYPEEEGKNHILFGNSILSGNNLRENPFAFMSKSFKEYRENTINTSVKITQRLDFITEGLQLTALVNFKNWSSNSYNRTIEPYFYHIKKETFNPDTGEFETERLGTSGTDYIAQSGISKNGDNTVFIQTSLDYRRSFNNHNLGAMLLYTQREYKNDVLPNRNQGISGRFTYDYNQRYLMEINFGYNGTERLSKHKRFEFFPAVSLGWVVSNEKFFEPVKNIISSLKFRGSYGLVGSDETGPSDAPHFLYIDKVNVIGDNRPGFTFGKDLNITRYGPQALQYAVENEGWERVKKFDVGVDLEICRQFSLIFDYFFDRRYNILLHREAWPESLGFYTAKPWSNKGKVNNMGYELSAVWKNSIRKDLSFELRGTFTYTQNKYVDLDEPLYPHTWKTATGKPLSRTVGYIADGLFKSQEEIDNSPIQNLGSTVMPGDIKYRDVNGDGKITDEDQVMISPYGSMPRIQYGIGLNVDYKNFNIGVFFNGSAMRTLMISGITPFGQNDHNVMKFISENYWTEANPNPNAAYPRLGITSSQVGNNTPASTYWMRDGSFLRFKTLEMGYRFKFARVYFSANNLFVFSPFKLWDPELAWNSYPLQRTFNLGVQVSF